MQLERIADERDAEQYEQSLDQRDGARILQHFINLVENDGNNQDIGNIERSHRRKNAADRQWNLWYLEIDRHKQNPLERTNTFSFSILAAFAKILVT